MAKKNFQTAPKPISLSDSDIEAFEKGGIGKDTKQQTHKPTNVVFESEPVKRLSIDLPESLHVRFKTACSATKRKMAKEVEAFIVAKTLELEKEAGITKN